MKEKIHKILSAALGAGLPIELSVPDEESFGHYSTNLAMRLAKERAAKPMDLAAEFVAQIKEKSPADFFEKIEAAPPGFINLWLNPKTLEKAFEDAAGDVHYGINTEWKGKTVMVEFTDPNPFKLFHIGHLMSNTIGESFSRLYESSGAKVLRANYQGDVGLHVAKAIWGMSHADHMPEENAAMPEKVKFLGEAYATGAKAYEERESDKKEIISINEKIYAKTDVAINDLYAKGKQWSLDYFETIYARLGTAFDHYFFESEVGADGLKIVAAHKNIFEESDGAIVFRGEEHGLHTRVFVNSQGLPTYETKELGLNKKKFELYPLDRSVVVTGNEIIDYFKVLLKVMGLIIPDVAEKTRHIAHGMLRLPQGKMSSRTGEVITAESLIEQVKAKLAERVGEYSELDEKERTIATEVLAIGAIKYSILKQNPGQDIIFDFEKSLSIHGDSGPYLAYTYARLESIVRKAGSFDGNAHDLSLLDSDTDRSLMRKILEFPDVVARARAAHAPSTLSTYLHQLASAANKFYETTPILKDENEKRRNGRLSLVVTAARTLNTGLGLLGIKALKKI